MSGIAGATLRVWRVEGSTPAVLAGPAVAWTPDLSPPAVGPRALTTPDGPASFEPLADGAGAWLEVATPRGGAGALSPRALAEIVGAALGYERELRQIAGELTERYEEIDLIYTISEILGQTIRLDEAADRILKEVATVARARRASLLVLDEERKVLRIVAAQGMDRSEAEPVELDDTVSVAARAFRERKIVGYDPSVPGAVNPGGAGSAARRGYRGRAFLSVPITYAPPGGAPRAVGVINLTDRSGGDAFTAGDRKLVAAIANQIGAAIANARLVQRDLTQQRLRRELELAHDLQLRLLPSPLVIAAKQDVAVRCRPAESVGGDFYNLLPLHDDQVGVMLGDVASHGFSAALIMALVVAASGIHGQAVGAPSEVLHRLEDSLAQELARTEMFLSVFYAVIDPRRQRLTYANAGHPHAFVVDCRTGESRRLLATRPPLALGAATGGDKTEPWPRRERLLCLFTDGIADALSERATRFGEDRVLGHVTRMRERPTQDILEAIFSDLAAFTGGAPAADDRTLLLLKA